MLPTKKTLLVNKSKGVGHNIVKNYENFKLERHGNIENFGGDWVDWFVNEMSPITWGH